MSDPLHKLLASGPLEISIACKPGVNPGAIEEEISLTFTQPTTELAEQLTITEAEGIKSTTTTTDTEAIVPEPATEAGGSEFQSAERHDETAEFIFDEGAASVWLSFKLGVVGGTSTKGAPAHCYAAGVEV